MSDTDSFRPVKRRFNLPTDQCNRLRTLLEDWRERCHRERGAGDFFSSQVALPPKQLNTIIDTCQRFLQFKEVSQSVVLSIVRWDSATDQDLDEICTLIQDWRAGINIPWTPQSQRRPTKKSRVESDAVQLRQRRLALALIQFFLSPTLEHLLQTGRYIVAMFLVSKYLFPVVIDSATWITMPACPLTSADETLRTVGLVFGLRVYS